jgi:hypothetical protein
MTVTTHRFRAPGVGYRVSVPGLVFVIWVFCVS